MITEIAHFFRAAGLWISNRKTGELNSQKPQNLPGFPVIVVAKEAKKSRFEQRDQLFWGIRDTSAGGRARIRSRA